MLQNLRIRRIMTRVTIATIACLEIMFFPLSNIVLRQAAAQEAEAPTDTTVVEPAPATTETTGPTSPTGAESDTYTFNPETGLWENDYYTWDPVTKQTKPKVAPDYSYNPETGHWDTTEWYYDAAAGKYVENTVSTPAPAPVALTTGTTATDENAPTTTQGVDASALQAQSLSGDPDDNSTLSLDSSTTGIFDLYFNANISHNISLDSASGNVTISGNTLAGDGLSGNSDAIANIINMLQSSWDPSAGNLNLFNVDIEGDVFGDFYIDPSQMFGDIDQVNSSANNDLDVNVEVDANMENNIDIVATSGNVTGTSNTAVGNLASGTANAVANVVNMINSVIASGDSFIGNINIYGNYEGDILLPEESLKTLLASNDVPKTTLNASQLMNNQAVVDINNDHSVTNTINADASSGNVTLASNTKAGSATSGDASTNITVLNLTGQQVVGSNALLVFVNVLGEWVGLLVNAPAGATSAALASGDTQQTQVTNNSLDATVDNDFEINNNINLNAHSGNVLGEKNTSVGNATSGDATASANIANVTNSGFSLSKWFGLLFINVFGKWHGSFGINTAAGNAPVTPSSNPAQEPESTVSAPAQVFRFVPSDTPIATSYASAAASVVSEATQEALQQEKSTSAVAGSSDSNNGPSSPTALQAAFDWSTLVPVGFLSLLAFGFTEGVVFLNSRRKATMAL
jgi:hypothetical protein